MLVSWDTMNISSNSYSSLLLCFFLLLIKKESLINNTNYLLIKFVQKFYDNWFLFFVRKSGKSYASLLLVYYIWLALQNHYWSFQKIMKYLIDVGKRLQVIVDLAFVSANINVWHLLKYALVHTFLLLVLNWHKFLSYKFWILIWRIYC